MIDGLQTLEDHARAHVSAPHSVGEKPEAHARNILAIDLGTNTGWAIRRRDGSISHGTECFPLRKREHPGQRLVNFRVWLSRLIEHEHVHDIVYERVVFGHSSSDAANLYGAFWGQMLACAAVRNIIPVGVAVSTVKKHWTGSGRADKGAMVTTALCLGFRPVTDNDADALAILSWACAREVA